MVKKDDQDFWNFVYSLFFILVSSLLILIVYLVRGNLPTSIPIFDFILIILAAFRITRLFVYDKITRFVRDFFTVSEEKYTEEGVTYFEKKEPMQGPKRTAYDLLTCPWCFSVWASVVLVFFYFVTPISWIVICMLAISGVASFIQITANMVGWSAENGKLQASHYKK